MALIKHYVQYHGFPKAIINDRGIQFTSAVWVIICGMLGIERRLFSAYHLEINGVIKRVNQIIQPYLYVYTIFS